MDAGVLGAILFGRNVGTAAETSLLVRQLKSRAGRPFAVAVDQEGGRVARLRGAPYTPLPDGPHRGQRGVRRAAQPGHPTALLVHRHRERTAGA